MRGNQIQPMGQDARLAQARRHSSGRRYRMDRMVRAAILGILSVLAISGCGQMGAGANRSSGSKGAWQLIWTASPASSSGAAQTPEQAFAEHALAQDDGKAPQSPSSVSWLMEGSDTAFALVQLDTTGQHFALCVLTRSQASQRWTLDGSLTLARPSQQDADLSNEDAHALSFPVTGYQSGEYHRLASPRYSLWLWLSLPQTGQVFAIARFSGHVARPGTGTAPVAIAGNAGWQTTQHGVSAVVVPMPDSDTLVVAGLTVRAQVQSIASKAIGQLDSRLRM